MKRFCLLCYIFLSALSLNGYGVTKTLSEQMMNLPDDKARVEALIGLANKAGKSDPNHALEYAQQALAISDKTHDKQMIAYAQKAFASANYDAQNFNKSIEYGKLCEPFFEKSHEYERLASLYNMLSSSYFNIGNTELNKFYSDRCIRLAEEHQMSDMLYKQYYNRSAIAFYQGNYTHSMEYASKALALAKKEDNTLFLAYCYDLLGSLSNQMSNYRNAIGYFDRSRQIYLTEGDKVSFAQTYINTASAYLGIKQSDSARLCFHEALRYYKDAESFDGISMAYKGIATCFKQDAKYDSAQIYIDKSLKTGLLSESVKDLTNSYLEAGEINLLQKKPQQALTYFYKSLSFNRQNGYKENEVTALKAIGQCYAALHAFDSAFHYLSRSVAIRDSLNKIDNVQKRAYQLAEENIKEQVQEEMVVEQQKRELWFIIVSLCVVVILVLSLLIRSLSVRQQKIQSINAELNKYKSDLELILQDKTRDLVLSEQQILNLSNNLPNGAIFRFVFENEREGRTLFVSSGWEGLTGQSIEAAKDSVFFFQNRIHPDDSRELLKQLAIAIRNYSILDMVYRFYKNNTEMRWFHVRAVAIAGDDGLTYLDGYQVDETEQKYFEQELMAAKDKAEESDRLKSAFLANMSHEIRTPMNAIIGFSSLLSNAQLPPKRQSAYLELVQENCHYLLRLIDDIVDISKMEAEQLSLRMETCQIAGIMNSIREYFEPIIHTRYPHVELWIDENFQNTSLTIHTDVYRLKQIFVNLIENALKFTEKGFVRCGYLLDRNDAIHFYVMDTGIGIAHENMDSIFQSFIKLDQYSGGTGLGLAIVKRLLFQMGGSIWVESEPSVGSTFHFTLPLPLLP